MQQLLNRVEAGFKGIIDASAPVATVFAGQTADMQVRPSVVVVGESGEEMPIGSGNFKVSVLIQVRSNADDSSEAVHETLCETVFGAVMTDSVGTDVSALGLGVWIQDPVVGRRASESVEDDCWLSELRFDAYSCLQSLA